MNNLTKKQKRELRKQERRQEQTQREKKSRIRRLLMWACVIGVLAVIVALLLLNAKTSIAPTENGDAALPSALRISDSDHTKGTPSNAISLIEYSDFQCPACASYYPLVAQLTSELSDKLYFAYRHFPLPQHSNATFSAEAAEAAGLQGKFFDMHDTLFRNQSDWAPLSSNQAKESFTKYAKELGLNMDQFQQDFKSDAVKNVVQKNYKSGLAARVDATPTFFLNGKKLSAPQNYEAFKKLILET